MYLFMSTNEVVNVMYFNDIEKCVTMHDSELETISLHNDVCTFS